MSRRKKQKPAEPPTYVMIDPVRAIADDAFGVMTSAERGLDRLIEGYLYLKGGKWKLDRDRIRKLSNWDGSGDFDQALDWILKEKYRIRRGFITRDDISNQIDRAIKKRDQARDAANKKWEKAQSDRNADAERSQSGSNAIKNESNRSNEDNEKNRSNEKGEPGEIPSGKSGPLSTSGFLRLYDRIDKRLKPLSNVDRQTIKKTIKHINTLVESGQFNGNSWDTLSRIVAEAQRKNVKNRMAYFVGSVKNEFGEF